MPHLTEKPVLDRIVDAVFPRIIPRTLAKIILLKIAHEFITFGFMNEQESGRMKSPRGYVPNQRQQQDIPEDIRDRKLTADSQDSHSLSRDTVLTLHRLIDLTFPHEKIPSRHDFRALTHLAHQNGISERQVVQYLFGLLDDGTLKKIGLKED